MHTRQSRGAATVATVRTCLRSSAIVLGCVASSVCLILARQTQAQMNVDWQATPAGQEGDTFTQKWTVLADPAGTLGIWTWHHQLGTTAGDVIYAGPQYVGAHRTHYFSFTAFGAAGAARYTNGSSFAQPGFRTAIDTTVCDGSPPCYLIQVLSDDSDTQQWNVGEEEEYRVTLENPSAGIFDVKFYVRNLSADNLRQYTGRDAVDPGRRWAFRASWTAECSVAAVGRQRQREPRRQWL